MKYVVAISAVALALSSCASRGTTTHFRAGVAADTYLTDVSSCQEAGREAANNVGRANPNNPALGSQAGAAFGAGFAEGLAKGKAMNDAFESCMTSRNYRQVALTPEEKAQFRAIRDVEERKSWLASFAARDLDSRAIPPAEAAVCKPNLLVTCAN